MPLIGPRSLELAKKDGLTSNSDTSQHLSICINTQSVGMDILIEPIFVPHHSFTSQAFPKSRDLSIQPVEMRISFALALVLPFTLAAPVPSEAIALVNLSPAVGTLSKTVKTTKKLAIDDTRNVATSQVKGLLSSTKFTPSGRLQLTGLLGGGSGGSIL